VKLFGGLAGRVHLVDGVEGGVVDVVLKQGILNKGEGSVQLTSSLR
jgi:hypothetical protein